MTVYSSREVLTTTARGVHHTRASRDPSDFAEAMMDWYLVGALDLMITSNPKVYTFGTTAALRTAMPVYNGETCLKMQVVQPDDYHLEDYNK